MKLLFLISIFACEGYILSLYCYNGPSVNDGIEYINSTFNYYFPSKPKVVYLHKEEEEIKEEIEEVKIIRQDDKNFHDKLLNTFANQINKNCEKEELNLKVYKYLVKKLKFNPLTNLIEVVKDASKTSNNETKTDILKDEVVKFSISKEESWRFIAPNHEQSKTKSETHHNILVRLPKSIKTTPETQIKIVFRENTSKKIIAFVLNKVRKKDQLFSFNVEKKDLIQILNGINPLQGDVEKKGNNCENSVIQDESLSPINENNVTTDVNHQLSDNSYFRLVFNNLNDCSENPSSFSLLINFKNEHNSKCVDREKIFDFGNYINHTSDSFYELGIQKLDQSSENDLSVCQYNAEELKKLVDETYDSFTKEERKSIIVNHCDNKKNKNASISTLNSSTTVDYPSKSSVSSNISPSKERESSQPGEKEKEKKPDCEHLVSEKLKFYFFCYPCNYFVLEDKIRKFFGFQPSTQKRSSFLLDISPIKEQEEEEVNKSNEKFFSNSSNFFDSHGKSSDLEDGENDHLAGAENPLTPSKIEINNKLGSGLKEDGSDAEEQVEFTQGEDTNTTVRPKDVGGEESEKKENGNGKSPEQCSGRNGKDEVEPPESKTTEVAKTEKDGLNKEPSTASSPGAKRKEEGIFGNKKVAIAFLFLGSGVFGAGILIAVSGILKKGSSGEDQVELGIFE